MTRRDRIVRLLEARLECLADLSERSLAGVRPLDPRVLALEAATRHAIALGLLSSAEAKAVWAAVGRRHPEVAWCRDGWHAEDGRGEACLAPTDADSHRAPQAS